MKLEVEGDEVGSGRRRDRAEEKLGNVSIEEMRTFYDATSVCLSSEEPEKKMTERRLGEQGGFYFREGAKKARCC